MDLNEYHTRRQKIIVHFIEWGCEIVNRPSITSRADTR